MGSIMYMDKKYGGGGVSYRTIAPIESSITSSKAYFKGDLLFYGSTLYRVLADISQGGTIVISGASANVAPTDIDIELKNSIKTSSTAGLVKNDGTIDTSDYATESYVDNSIPGISVSNTGTASSTGVRKQQIAVNDTDYDIFGTSYMEQNVLLSTSDVTIATFTNADITTDSDIEVSVSDWSCVPENVSATTGTCAVTLPQVDTAATVRVRIYIR